jgi:hypothetical protein
MGRQEVAVEDAGSLTEAGIRTPSASTFLLSLGLVSSLLFEKKSSLDDELQTFDSVANVG